MTENTQSKYIGKFVCFNSIDGGVCWGRIKDECKVNTSTGEKEAFILTERLVRYLRAKSGMTVRTVNPGSMASRAMGLNPQTGQVAQTEMVHEVSKIWGDSILLKEMINLDRDIIDIESAEVWKDISDETLFLALMKGKELGSFGNDALALGLSHLMGSDGMEEYVKSELKKRLERKEK